MGGGDGIAVGGGVMGPWEEEMRAVGGGVMGSWEEEMSTNRGEVYKGSVVQVQGVLGQRIMRIQEEEDSGQSRKKKISYSGLV